MATLWTTNKGFRFPYRKWAETSTPKNLLFMEALLEKYLHIHETANNTLYVTKKGYRVPKKLSMDNLEENMKFVEMQLEQALHEHEISGSGETEKLTDPDVELQQSGIPDLDDPLTSQDHYQWHQIGNPGNVSVHVHSVNPQATTNHVRFELTGDIGTRPNLILINPNFSGDFRVMTAQVTPGEVLTPSFYARKTPLFGSGFDQIDAVVDFYDSTPLLMPETVTEDLGPMTTSYQQFTMNDITVPAGAAYVVYRFVIDIFFSGDIVDMDTFSLKTGDPVSLVTTHRGFRFPYNWDNEQNIRLNMNFLEGQMTKYLHLHEVST